jgi:lipopolysaccharide/colanic/teichoic acid biosynthesis glycosyltransferase
MTMPVIARRTLNVVVAALGLLLLAPVMVLIAIAVRLSSAGPARFVQIRIGIDRRRRDSAPNTGTRKRDLGGAPFAMIKFRTMHVHKSETEQWATKGDARVTAVGRVLRQFRLDELPQLFNVLRGEMSVVGPRPEQPLIFARLRDSIARYARRQRVEPGITGWAQINLAYDRNEDDVRRKLRYDLEYIDRQSFSEDLRIMVRTVPVMLGRRGAQ